MHKWSILLVITFLVFVSTIVGCASTPPAAQTAAPAAPAAAPAAAPTAPAAPPAAPTTATAPKSTSPIKIGWMAVRSGNQAQLGEDIMRAMQFAFDEVKNEVAGRKIEVIYEDDKGEPATALSKAKKLIESDKVQMLIGPLQGQSQAALLPYIESNKMPQLIWAGNSQVWREGKSPYVFSGHTFVNSTYTAVMAKYLAEKGFKKAAIQSADMIVGHDVATAFKKVFEAGGGKVVLEQFNPNGTSDFAPYVGKIDPKEVDVVWAWVSGADTNRFLTAYSQYGLKGKVQLTGVTNVIDNPTAALGEAATSGVMASSWWDAGINTPSNMAWQKAFKAKYNDLPNLNHAFGYQTARVLIEAIKSVNGNIEDKATFLKALETNVVDLPWGKLRYDDAHVPIQDVYVLKCCKVNEGFRGGEVVATYKDVDQWFVERITGEKK